jgi:phosphoserine phosphatase RsbX
MTCLEWSAASASIEGEVESGDLAVVEEFEGGVLVAVIDGLGHGPDAASAARVAAGELSSHCREPIEQLLERCHRALRGTRGVVMSLASVEPGADQMHWLGIGDVMGVLFRTNGREWIINRGGVVGFRLPTLRRSTVPIAAGDVLIFATDGIRDDFADRLLPGGPSSQLAQKILAQSRKRTDDALVLVARYLGA